MGTGVPVILSKTTGHLDIIDYGYPITAQRGEQGVDGPETAELEEVGMLTK